VLFRSHKPAAGIRKPDDRRIGMSHLGSLEVGHLATVSFKVRKVSSGG